MKATLFYISVFFTSCVNTSKIAGNYKIEKNNIEEMTVTLNRDKTFVEYVHCYGGEKKHYFGYYKRVGKTLYLDQITQNLGHLHKSDTLIYGSALVSDERLLYVYYNQSRPFDVGEVYINQNMYLGKLDSLGRIKLPPGVKIDSVCIRSVAVKPRTIPVRDNGFGQAFLMLYDLTFEDCSVLSYESRFQIRKGGLRIFPNWERAAIARPVKLQKGN